MKKNIKIKIIGICRYNIRVGGVKMAMYDMNAKFVGQKLTYISLCKELMTEFEEKTGETAPGEEYFRDKLKNTKKNGVINKLNILLGTDIEQIVKDAEDPTMEKFKLLKLVKLIYYIEKDGSAKCTKTDGDNVRILITDILREPHLENIKTQFSDKSIYGECFERLYDQIKEQVPDAEKRIKQIEDINICWEYITDIVFDYVITDKALDSPKDALQELDRIYRFLKDRVLGRLDVETPPVTYEKGIFENFFDLLVSHRVMCSDRDRLNINYRICESKEPERRYVDLYRSQETYGISHDNIKVLEDYICGEIEHEGAREVMAFILGGIDKKYRDIKACKFAIKNYETVLEWWVKGKDDVDVSKDVALDTFVAIMQELIVVYKDKEKLTNDYLGYKYYERTLTASVKKPKNADAIAVQAWIKKLENRVAADFGAMELIKKKREIENIIYEIKRYIFSFYNLEDMLFVNSQIYYIASRNMISRELAMEIGDKFASNVCKYLSSRITNINFILDTEGVNVFNMFRDFSIDKSGAIDNVAKKMAYMVNELYEDEDGLTGIGEKIYVNISWSDQSLKQSMLTFCADRNTDSIVYKQYVGVESDENCDRMKKLGLGKFIVNHDSSIKFY